MTKIQYIGTPQFKRDFKKLQKKFNTLKDDLSNAQAFAIKLFHTQNINNHSIEEIPGFQNNTVRFYKLRKFACKALKGRGVKSGIRIIYAYNHQNQTITFLELYFKTNKQNEDQERIKSFLTQILRESSEQS